MNLRKLNSAPEISTKLPKKQSQLMRLYNILKPCYDRKIFWVNGQLVTFEFGEYSISDATDKITTYIIATYVWHKTDATGNPTGTSGYHLNQVNSRAEGQDLLEAATEAGAASWLEQWQKEPPGTSLWAWFQTQCHRQVLHRLWQLRRWKRLKNAHS